MTITRARGSELSRCATSSRQALSTLLKRERLRGNPAAMQETASAGRAGSSKRTEQSDDAVLLWSSVTRTVMLAVAGGVVPVKSNVAFAPEPVTRPVEALHA